MNNYGKAVKIYKIKCREKTLKLAVLNGHALVWPECEARETASGIIKFYKDGKLVWSCNKEYFKANFDHEEIDR